MITDLFYCFPKQSNKTKYSFRKYSTQYFYLILSPSSLLCNTKYLIKSFTAVASRSARVAVGPLVGNNGSIVKVTMVPWTRQQELPQSSLYCGMIFYVFYPSHKQTSLCKESPAEVMLLAFVLDKTASGTVRSNTENGLHS